MDLSSGSCRMERADWRLRLMLAAWIALVGLAWLAPSGPAAAEPMDLRNAEARFVTVRFETSPAELPGQFDAVYGVPLTAWLEPEPGTTRMRLTIPADAVERHLLGRQEPIPGSFSDFVWTFDAETGHVHSARVEGSVICHLDWGLVTSRAKARLRFEMDTFRTAGYRKPRSVLGQPVNSFCDPDEHGDCQRVSPLPYDPTTGYVNAVGPIDVENAVLGMRTFSTIGEAVFSDREAARAERDASPADLRVATTDTEAAGATQEPHGTAGGVPALVQTLR